MTTLVIGARGGIGRHVLDQLLTAGEPVRASVRDHRAAAGLPAAADLTRPDTLRPVLDGVRRVFLYAPPSGAEGFAVVAAEAGVERVVLLSSGSVLLPGTQHNAIAAQHRAIEDALTADDLPWTPVRPLVLASNTLRWAQSIRSGRAVSLVYPDAITAPIHERDTAAVAVAALRADLQDAAAEEVTAAMLTGPDLISQRRQVEVIGQAIGRTLRVEELSPDQAREHYGRFTDPATVEAILQFQAAAVNGGSPRTHTVQRVLGRPGLSFEQWALPPRPGLSADRLRPASRPRRTYARRGRAPSARPLISDRVHLPLALRNYRWQSQERTAPPPRTGTPAAATCRPA